MVFCVIYRWKVAKKDETDFIRIWKGGTDEVYRLKGSLGSSLHKLSDGTYLAYARWPSRQAWEKMMIDYNNTKRNPLGVDLGRPLTMDLISDLLKNKLYKR